MRRVERIWLGRMLKGILFFLIFILIGTSVVEMQIDELTLNHDLIIQNHVSEAYQQAAAMFYNLAEEVSSYYTDWIKEVGNYFETIL